MNRLIGLMRDTWWLWLGLIAGGVLLGTLVDVILFASIPISIFSFLYFGFMRYDDDGNPKEG